VEANDKQIEILIRRFGARSGGPNGGGSHLDADEMNAFAEGVLPQAARARYVSHLAECDECRRQVADLAITSGAISRAEQTAADKVARVGFWASLAGLFALPALRYAAFAVVLVAVAGVSYFALRQRSASPTSLVAKRSLNEGDQPSRPNAVAPPTDSNNGLVNPSGPRAETSTALPSTGATPIPPSQLPAGAGTRQEEFRPTDTGTVPAEPMKEAAKAPEIAEKKAAEPDVAARPYSPAPPGEAQSVSRGQSQVGGIAAAPGGPKQTQQVVTQADKAMQTERELGALKDQRLDDRDRKSDQPSLAGRRANDDKLKGGPSRNIDNTAAMNNRAANETVSTVAAKTEGHDEEDRAQTRSAGGHKFRKQGNAWVDQKFKASLSLKNVARGSEEFSSLDSGLRSIAQQISGEIIVVWKGKAYLIK